MHHFEPGGAAVGRQVTIDTQTQKRRGASHKLKVEAAPLPNLSRVKPKGAKGIEGVISVVLNPIVRSIEDDQEWNEFDPPLDISVQYTEADAKATTLDAKGNPKLSLALVYQSENGWKWERLKTEVIPSRQGGGTLRAKIRTLRPQDPIVMCRP
jgi:hypothetical protein